MFTEGDKTHYGHLLENCNIRECYFQALDSADAAQLRKEVEEFNSKNKWKKRGLAAVPTKFGISYAECFLNQVIFDEEKNGRDE